MPLDGRVAIITGASRGLGADIARYLAKHGATVVLAARSVEAPLHERIPGSLKEVEASITEAGGTATSIATNMRDTESIRACVEQTAARFGRIDIVVNNAVVVVPGRLEATEDRRIELMWQVDLRGPLLLIKYALPYLKASGAGDILNISSGAARFPGPGPYPDRPRGQISVGFMYGTLKSGLDRATQALAIELQEDRVKVNSLSPGELVRTPGTVFSLGIDVPEGGYDVADWMGRTAVWMCEQPLTYTGNIVFDTDFRDRVAHL